MHDVIYDNYVLQRYFDMFVPVQGIENIIYTNERVMYAELSRYLIDSNLTISEDCCDYHPFSDICKSPLQSCTKLVYCWRLAEVLENTSIKILLTPTYSHCRAYGLRYLVEDFTVELEF